MGEVSTLWQAHLETLRPHLTGRDHRGKKGSLRWLEAAVAERGGRAGTVRNILYKDLGSPEEKLRLFEVLCDLYTEVGLEPPPLPSELALESARRALGRDKRRLFRRFLRALEQGDKPQMVVVGGPATGKGVLLSAVQRAVPDCLMVNLGGELAPHLHPLAERLGVELEGILSQLSPTQPYALQAALQDELRNELARALNACGRPLLLRAEREGQLGGLSLRDAQGNPVGLSAWIEPLLRRLTIPFLAGLSEPPPNLAWHPLSAPSRAEARRYVKDRLPDLPPERVEALVNQAGRNFAELSRLVLLEAAQTQGSAPNLAQDTALRPILHALAVLSPEADPGIPVPLLEKALGKGLEHLSQAERALLAPLGEGKVRPALRTLLPSVPEREARKLHLLALDYFKNDLFRQLHHAWGAGRLDRLLELLSEDPSRLALLPNLWSESKGWPSAERERLAMAVVRYRAVLGQYAHPEALEALEVLFRSADSSIQAWARVKAAEARVDAGNFTAALELLPPPEALSGEIGAEGLLVWAAVERWQGDYAQAEAYVQQALALPIPPFLADRVRLWQGLVAKDAGRFEEALSALRQVSHDPLLVGRARYQSGDLLLRIGRVYEAEAHMRQGLAALESSGAPPEEVARVRARFGSVLRRIGNFAEAERCLYQSIQEATDEFIRARAMSEASVLELARGRPLEALELLAQAERYLREVKERPEEAHYRHRRTLYRIAVAYWVRACGLPYLPPYVGGQQAPDALRILRELERELSTKQLPGDRYVALAIDVALKLSLLLPADQAEQMMQGYLKQNDPYFQAQARLGYAETLARQEKWAEALAQVVQIGELQDPGVQAWKLGLETQALLGLGQEEAAWKKLQSSAGLPTPYRAQLGRVLGRIWPQEALRERLQTQSPLALEDCLSLRLSQTGPYT
ncbi:MAG: tetratricopeptide repeat protein [Meiothermus sp.]|uniref:tetratricopeptide repeat protein n=1 Tax=Meiothermus sp. TaxID=1955249 RepID=UPI0025F726FD|nr:tetratricopeptide repeat protein [Meiothermus sp.]MCS7057709.1 tetratricopeptide repeat protein [Meiothermus sp.]MCS7193376.1 tetratricopeptide repeat protein [Meiothermus sp.]MCX7739870.1 tetratricopeptide repeat protein [Meiothermus sp.]MDW8090889.1 tetratricopeptide repeat protein [Meiothermus sp.]MDW8482027.1 tetratricopeptide repeat protein [Meiothermus sp.]